MAIIHPFGRDDVWLLDKPFRETFSRLFSLSVQKTCNISEMGLEVEGFWSWDLKWKRNFFE